MCLSVREDRMYRNRFCRLSKHEKEGLPQKTQRGSLRPIFWNVFGHKIFEEVVDDE